MSDELTQFVQAIKKIAAPGPLLLTKKATAEYLGVSTTTLTTWCELRPGFPQPIRPSGSNADPYWKRKDLEAWVERMK